jgi:trehalose 6-phosphate synthase
LIVVSNRVADLDRPSQSGGLATALVDALSEEKGLWFGWDGSIIEDGLTPGVSLARQGAVATATQPLTQSEYDSYYLGFANGVLWPVCHYRLDLARFDAENAAGYHSVNARFASTLAALVDADDVIWVHDYHLFPLAAELRKIGIKNRIGFFLHIPFPPPDVLTAVPDHNRLVTELFDYDLLGFQTEQDVRNFAGYVENQLAGVEEAGGLFRAANKSVIARSFPIGVDVENVRAMATTPEADRQIASMPSASSRTYIIGVDRLDYSKGLPDRFRAYRRFLGRWPEVWKMAALMQVAAPTREELAAYADIRQELEQLSGSINGEFGDFDWTPLRYIHRALPRETLAALFRGCKVGLVTPLRDGMNLVAKEYVAAQDTDNPGVLILSQFAGAAEDLEEAIIVNPYDIEDVATALHRAMVMRIEERKERHAALLERVKTRDVEAWRTSFLEALQGAKDRAA